MTFDRSVWDGTKPIVSDHFGARSTGPFVMIEPAMEVWTDINARRDPHDEPLGGMVLEVTQAVFSDGEVVRSFRTFDYTLPLSVFRKAFRTVAEADIERDSITACNPSLVAKTVFKFCGEIAKTKHRTLWLDDNNRLLADAYTLARTLMAGNW